MKNKIFLGLVLAFGLVAPLVYATAADYFPKDEKDLNNVVVNSEQIEKDDVYIVGGTISTNKKVLGDLMSFGSSINVLSGVDEDLFAIGGNVMVDGPILGDARVLGGNITVNNGAIGEDLIVAGGTVLINKNTTVGGDLWAAGQTINMAGIVTGDLKIFGGEIFLNGIVTGNLEVESDSKLTFGPESKVMGTITYTGKKDPIIQEGAQIGSIERKSIAQEESKTEATGAIVFGLIFKLITLFVTVLVLLKLFGNKVKMILSSYEFSLSEKFWHRVGIGFLGLVLVPIVALLLLASVIGVYLSMILFVWYILAVSMSMILSSLLLGGMIQKFQKRNDVNNEESSFNLDLSWKTVLVGVLALGVLSLIPILGCIVIALVFMSAFGTIIVTVKERIMD